MSEIEDNITAVTSAPGNSCEDWVAELRIDMKKLGSPLSQECCIYPVPSNLRRVNEAAYTPQFVSIGPLHCGDENLKKMEKHKLKYLERFLKRAEGRGKSLEDFVGYVKVNELSVRRCYAETFDDLNSGQFARMILVDASFIIEHILRQFIRTAIDKIKKGHSNIFAASFLSSAVFKDEIREGHRLVFDIPRLRSAVKFDLVLLENQLPFFVLEGLYGMVYEDCPFSHISMCFFRHFNCQEKPTPEDVKHFTDLVRYYQLPKKEKEQTQTPIVHTHSSWFSDCSSRLSRVLQQAFQALLGVGFHVILLLLCQKPREDDEKNFDLLYSATELHEAGVTFKKGQSKCFLDIKFTNKGVLDMPCFTVDDNTEASIRNVMALEQCHYPHERHVCDYFILMDRLISTDKDVDLLVRSKILVNQLGSNGQVASVVNNLGLQINHNPDESHYSETIRKLNAYYEKPHHKWIAALRHVYFKTPWRSASTIAAIILLLLTLAQTIRSFLSP